MTVKKLSEKYQISRQAIYAKIKRKSAQLDGHIMKSGGQLVIDDYAEMILMPRPPDCFLLEKNKNLQATLNEKDMEAYNLKYECDRKMKKYENMKNELTEKNQKIENLQSELSEINRKIENFKNQLDEKNLKIADYEKSASALSEENLKLSETVRLLTNEILNRDEKIEELQKTNAELEAAAAKKLFGFPSKKG